jgi:hypothetical protein
MLKGYAFIGFIAPLTLPNFKDIWLEFLFFILSLKAVLLEMMKNVIPTNRKAPKDDGSIIKDSEWEAAVELLLKKIQHETWLSLKKSAAVIPRDWARIFQQIVGPAIRNLLRVYGFKWGDDCFNNNIPFLLEDAISRFEDNTVYFHATISILD